MKMKTKARKAALKIFIDRIWAKIYKTAEAGFFKVSVEIPESLDKYFVKKMTKEGFSIAWQHAEGDFIKYEISWS